MESFSSIISYDCVPRVGLSDLSLKSQGIVSNRNPLARPTFAESRMVVEGDAFSSKRAPVAIPSVTTLWSFAEQEKSINRTTKIKAILFIFMTLSFFKNILAVVYPYVKRRDNIGIKKMIQTTKIFLSVKQGGNEWTGLAKMAL